MGAADVGHPAVAGILAWWDAEGRDLPWRRSRDDWAILVAETMSHQTSVLRASAYWERWMARWPTPADLAAAPLAEVLAAWDGLGYPRRARNLHRAAQTLVTSGWPEDLTALPGVGPYTAAAVRCFAREEAVLPPDVNVRRVVARLLPGGVRTDGDPWRAGQAIMEFGQRVCRARPLCSACPVAAACPARDAAEDPSPRARRQPRYEGSLRQRRGDALRRVLAEGRVPVADLDAEAVAGLASDGLVALAEGGRVAVAPA